MEEVAPTPVEVVQDDDDDGKPPAARVPPGRPRATPRRERLPPPPPRFWGRRTRWLPSNMVEGLNFIGVVSQVVKSFTLSDVLQSLPSSFAVRGAGRFSSFRTLRTASASTQKMMTEQDCTEPLR